LLLLMGEGGRLKRAAPDSAMAGAHGGARGAGAT
jgi:hypothetical protein